MRVIAWVLASLLLCACGGDDGGGGGELRLGERARSPKGAVCRSSGDCAEDEARCTVEDPVPVCTGSLASGAFERECAGATSDAALTCAGFVCISLKPNAQHKAGQCSAPCVSDAECGSAGVCAAVLGGHYCFGGCGDDDPCGGGFVCVLGPGGRRLCSVTS